MSFDPNNPAAAGRVILLDGGMGQELIARAKSETTNWSSEALLSHPNLVREVHRDFFAAGAEVATTNNYAVHIRRFAEAAEREKLNTLAGRLAAEARDAHGSGRVAGCLPPYAGSYMPNAVWEDDVLIPLYAEQAATLAPFVDFYLCETMSTAREARAAATGAAEIGKPIWVSYTLKDDASGCLRSGESLAEALEMVAHLPIAAFLVNCSQVESLTAAMPAMAALGKPFGAYGNGFRMTPDGWAVSGQTSDALGRREDLGPDAYAEIAKGWVAAGATLIGGCCEIGPAHIATLKETLC